MSAAARVIECLQRVKQTGPGRWLGSCPAHEDKHPSLSIREVDDRVLLHDFGGCATADVLAAMGLTLSDLFDKPLTQCAVPLKSRIPASDVLLALDHEIMVASLLIEGAMRQPFSEDDRHRLAVASGRIKSGINYIRGLR
jgi:hypothetical protein